MSAPFFVAEIGANHLGDFVRAVDLVNAAADAGADAVKLQCWREGTMAANAHVTVPSGPWAGLTLDSLYAKCYTPWSWFENLKLIAEERGIELFASAFDLPSVVFLEELGVKRHKVASFELVDDELIRAVALTGKPIILSTGMASVEEIVHAIHEAEDMGATDITLLKCVSAYPSMAEDANLRAIPFLRNLTGFDVGLSDHSDGNAVAVAATALGATMIERHFTLTRKSGGPDAAFSLEPVEFATMVIDCRAAAAAVQSSAVGPLDSGRDHVALRRSLWWAADLRKGEMVLRDHIASARPADGLPCSKLFNVLGRYVKHDVKAGEPIREGEYT